MMDDPASLFGGDTASEASEVEPPE